MSDHLRHPLLALDAAGAAAMLRSYGLDIAPPPGQEIWLCEPATGREWPAFRL